MKLTAPGSVPFCPTVACHVDPMDLKIKSLVARMELAALAINVTAERLFLHACQWMELFEFPYGPSTRWLFSPQRRWVTL